MTSTLADTKQEHAEVVVKEQEWIDVKELRGKLAETSKKLKVERVSSEKLFKTVESNAASNQELQKYLDS